MSLYTSGNLTLEVRDDAYHRLDCHVIWEIATEYFPDQIDPRDLHTVLDIGANIGAYSCYVLANNPSAQVVAIEPELGNFRLLKRNLQRYGNSECAMLLGRCGYDKTLTRLVIDPANSGGHRCVRPDEAPVATTIFVSPPVVSVEALLDCTKDNRADLMKIDCEGGEVDILMNMPCATFERIEVIVGEWHMAYAQFQATIQARLAEFYSNILTRVNPENPLRGVFLARKS